MPSRDLVTVVAGAAIFDDLDALTWLGNNGKFWSGHYECMGSALNNLGSPVESGVIAQPKPGNPPR